LREKLRTEKEVGRGIEIKVGVQYFMCKNILSSRYLANPKVQPLKEDGLQLKLSWYCKEKRLGEV
jgi:hypothetical protein